MPASVADQSIVQGVEEPSEISKQRRVTFGGGSGVKKRFK